MDRLKATILGISAVAVKHALWWHPWRTGQDEWASVSRHCKQQHLREHTTVGIS